MSNIMPDSSLAATMRKKMSASQEPEGRENITHGPSSQERDTIVRKTGKSDGDYDEHREHVHNKEFDEE